MLPRQLAQQNRIQKQDTRRYEQGIGVVTTFFAAVIGFGLQHLLEGQGDGYIAAHKWPFFIVAVLLFLRFLIGATNHLWFERIQNPPAKVPNLLVSRDLVFLIVFGFLAATMCYVDSALQFYWNGMLLISAALTWVVVDGALSLFGITSAGNWLFWLGLDFLHLGFFALARSLAQAEVGSPSFTTWSWSLTLLVPASATILMVDFYLQLKQLER